mgnify:CR=1 FL=1
MTSWFTGENGLKTNQALGIRARSVLRQDAILQDILDLIEKPERFDGLSLVKIPICLRITAVRVDDVRSCDDFYTAEKTAWADQVHVNFVDIQRIRTLAGYYNKTAVNLGLTIEGLQAAEKSLHEEKHPDHQNIKIRTKTEWAKGPTESDVCNMVSTMTKMENLQRNLNDLTMQMGDGLPAVVLAIAARINFQELLNYAVLSSLLMILPTIDHSNIDEQIESSEQGDKELELRLLEEATRFGFFTVVSNASEITDPSTLAAYGDTASSNSMRTAYIQYYQKRLLPKAGCDINPKSFFIQLNRVIDKAPESDPAKSDIVRRLISVAKELVTPTNQQAPRVKRIMEEVKIKIFLWKYEATYAPLQFLDNNAWAQTNPICMLMVRARIHVGIYEMLVRRLKNCSSNTTILVIENAFTRSTSFMQLRNLFMSWQNRSPELFGNLKNLQKPLTGGIIQQAEEIVREKGGDLDLLGCAITRDSEPRLRSAINMQDEILDENIDASSMISREASIIEIQFRENLKNVRAKSEPVKLTVPIRNTCHPDMLAIREGEDLYQSGNDSDMSSTNSNTVPKKKSKINPQGEQDLENEFESMSMSDANEIWVEIDDYSTMSVDNRQQPIMQTIVPLANCMHTFDLMKDKPFKRLSRAQNLPVSPEQEVDKIPTCSGTSEKPICNNPVQLLRENFPLSENSKYFCRFCKQTREGTLEKNIELERKLTKILNDNSTEVLRSVIMGKVRVTVPIELIESVKVPQLQARSSKAGFIRSLENTWKIFQEFARQQKIFTNPRGKKEFDEKGAVENLGPAPRSAGGLWKVAYMNTMSILHTGGFKPKNEQAWADVLAHFRDIILQTGHFLVKDFQNEPNLGFSDAQIPRSMVSWALEGISGEYPVRQENGTKLPVFWQYEKMVRNYFLLKNV